MARPSASRRSRDSSSIQWQSSRTRTSGSRFERARRTHRQELLQRRLAHLGVEAGGEVGVGDVEAERGPPSRGARATRVGSIGGQLRLDPSRAGEPRIRRPRAGTAGARSRARRSSSCSCRTTGTRRSATSRPRRRADRTNSATSRDLPIPASAAMPTIRPSPAIVSSRASSRRASSARRPMSGSSNRVLPPRGPLERPVERVGHDRAPTCP